MSEQQVPTASRPQHFDIKGGGSVGVRRIAAHIRNDLYALASKGLTDEGAIGLKFAELAIRWGIVTAENVPNPEYTPGGDAPEFLSAQRKAEGRYMLVSRELYSAAAGDDDTAGQMLTAIMGTAPDDAMVGKPASSPGGSTRSDKLRKISSSKPEGD